MTAGDWTLLANLSILSTAVSVGSNTIAAGPTSGGAGAPSFRTMVAADIPSSAVTYAKIQNVAATNRPLSDMVSRGLFRADLYYRLGGVEIQVPPLRARREDVAELAAYFLSKHNHARELALSDAAMDALRVYTWPGNVRELERFVERAVALTETARIELDDLPPQIRGDYMEVLGASLTAGESMRAWGSRYARIVYERCGRNKRRACRQLDISYHTLEAYLRFPGRQPGESARQFPAWFRPGRMRRAMVVHERGEQR